MANLNLDDIPASVQLFITVLLCAVVLYFAYMLDFSSLRRKTTSAQQQETDFKTQLQASLATEAEINGELSQLPQLEKTLQTWQNTLVKPSELPELLNDILKIGTAYNLQFDLFNPGEKKSDGDYIKIPIKVIITGNYDQIANFISQVANMPLLVGITNFSISQQNQGAKKTAGTQGLLVADLTLEVNYLAEKTEKIEKKEVAHAT